jgi:ferredoxin-NADP reductase
MQCDDEPLSSISSELTHRNEVSSDIVELTFRPTCQQTFPIFRAGAHTMIALPNGIRRPYTLISDPIDGNAWRIAVRREISGRGGSQWLFENALPGLAFSVGQPQHGFGICADAAHHMFVAGGIGITPFLTMVLELSRSGESCELHYAVNDSKDAGFISWLGSVLGPNLHVYDALNRLNISDVFQQAPTGTHAYCCGPARMLKEFTTVTACWPPGTTHTERFSIDLIDDPNAQGQFRVKLASSGEIIIVPPGHSLLNTLLDAGYDVEVGCESGVCGECVVGVLNGDVLHHDICLSTERRMCEMTTCVSRGRGLLSLDL